VNQDGEIQSIGGVNEKIEGFFEACLAKGGLTGHQGVLIPTGNVEDLMLREDVIEAVSRGQFHVFPIATVEQGIEICTGEPAGRHEQTGTFPEGSVFSLVDRRLRAMADTLHQYE